MTVAPGTAFCAAAVSVARFAPVTAFSSLRIGAAPPGPGPPGPPARGPPGPGFPGALLAAGVGLVAEVVDAPALRVLARTPPARAPAASRPIAPAFFR